jgi:ABC-type Na+ efflux pump permease subunit
MRLWKSWVIARKDLATLRTKRYILYSLVVLPVVISIVLPAIIWYGLASAPIPLSQVSAIISGLNEVFNAFSFLFVIVAAMVPVSIASYSIVGEKLERTLEPLLATPTTDGEILMGKAIAAFVPSLIAAYAGAAIFMVLMDTATSTQLGYYYFPNWTIAVILLITVPLVTILSTEFSVIISARVSDVRAAQQFGALIILPLAGIFIATEVTFLSLTPANLLILSAIILIIDLFLFFLSKATFRREEILTKWK